MKINFPLFKITTIAALITIVTNAQTDTNEYRTEFICPMICSDFSSFEPASCPVCGMELKPNIPTTDKSNYKIIHPMEVKQLM